jgi:hypothetical protein
LGRCRGAGRWCVEVTGIMGGRLRGMVVGWTSGVVSDRRCMGPTDRRARAARVGKGKGGRGDGGAGMGSGRNKGVGGVGGRSRRRGVPGRGQSCRGGARNGGKKTVHGGRSRETCRLLRRARSFGGPASVEGREVIQVILLGDAQRRGGVGSFGMAAAAFCPGRVWKGLSGGTVPRRGGRGGREPRGGVGPRRRSVGREPLGCRGR